MKFLRFLGVVGIMSVAALSSANANDSSTVRSLLSLTSRDQWSAASALADRSDPVIQTMYEWMNLQREDEAQEFGRYAAFLKDHADWPYIRRIRANAERVMPTTISDENRIAFYGDDGLPVTAAGMIAYIRALDQTGHAARAKTVLNTWFMDASLTAAEQAQIMANLRSFLTHETVERRLDDLIVENHPDLARALAALMGEGYKELSAARIALANRTPDAQAKLNAVPKKLRDDPGLIYDRMKWRRRDDQTDGMIDLFRDLPAGFKPWHQDAFWTEHQSLIYRVLAKGDYTDAYQIAARPIYTEPFPSGQAEWMAGHIAYVYLNQPGRAFRHFERLYKMSKSPMMRARAAYWAGEASTALGYKDVADAWYKNAGAYRANFYGQLAAQKTNVIQSASVPSPRADQRQLFNESDVVQAARLFATAGDVAKTDLFLSRLADRYKGQPGYVRLVVDLATQLKRPNVALRISRMAGVDGIDFADYVYPAPKGLPTGDVDPALVYAVIRQESGFDPEIVSPAGAKGLMQLMPATAKGVAKKEGTAHQHDWLTDRPDHNVRLGVAYLKELLDRYEGSYALTAAAYNAGPRRVAEWIAQNGDPRTGDITLVNWIERIPVYETRNYVQRILEGAVIYRKKMGPARAAFAYNDHLQTP